MNAKYDRRKFITESAALITAGTLPARPALTQQPAAQLAPQNPGNLRLATFRFDATPPTGHSLCGGWIKPVVGVDDPLEAIGYVFVGIRQTHCGVCTGLDWTIELGTPSVATGIGRVSGHYGGSSGNAMRASTQRSICLPGC